eukprot:5326694-Pleurochrysis_carterae.AAC.1
MLSLWVVTATPAAWHGAPLSHGYAAAACTPRCRWPRTSFYILCRADMASTSPLVGESGGNAAGWTPKPASVGTELEQAQDVMSLLAVASRIAPPEPPFDPPHLAQDEHQLKRQQQAGRALGKLANMLVGSATSASRYRTLADPRMVRLAESAAAPSVCRADGENELKDRLSARAVVESLVALSVVCAADAVERACRKGNSMDTATAERLAPLRRAACALILRTEVSLLPLLLLQLC